MAITRIGITGHQRLEDPAAWPWVEEIVGHELDTAPSPVVVVTSNRTREVHDALKRRCLYHWIGYPPPEREVEIVLVRAPGVSEVLAGKVVAAVNRLREMELAKPPGVAETIDWVRTLDFLGETGLDTQVAEDTLGAVVKERDDLELVRDNLEEITSGA